MVPMTYGPAAAMMPMTPKPPTVTFRRIQARHTLFKLGVGGLLLATLLFTLGFSAPAWLDRSGLWMDCSYGTCFTNMGVGPGESAIKLDQIRLDQIRLD